MPDQGRDRLRELLDAVLDEDNRTLEEMAGVAFPRPTTSVDNGDPIDWLRRRSGSLG